MNNKAIDSSLLAIQQVTSQPKFYLEVVGKGQDQQIVAVKKSWLGRILMWLGLTSACMKTVANFFHAHFETLYQNGSSQNKSSLSAFAGKITRYNNRHSNKLQGIVDHINHVIVKKTQAGANASTPHVPNSQFAISPVPPHVAATSVTPAKSVGSGTSVIPKQNSLEILKKTLKSYKKATVRGINAYPMPKSPHIHPGQSPEITKDQLKEEYQFANSESDLNAMNRFLKTYIDDLNADVRHYRGPRFAFRMGVIMDIMSNDDIRRFAQDASEVDIFQIRQATVHCPHARFIGAVGLMSYDQLSSLIETISTSDKWDLVYLRDAYLKISNMIPKGSSDNKFLELIVRQPKFIETNVRQTSCVPSSQNKTERAWEEAEFIMDERLSACYVHTIINEHDKLTDFINFRCHPQDEGSLIKAHSFISGNRSATNNFISHLSKKDMLELGMFLVKNFHVDYWKDSLLLKELLLDKNTSNKIFLSACDAVTAMILVGMCNSIESLVSYATSSNVDKTVLDAAQRQITKLKTVMDNQKAQEAQELALAQERLKERQEREKAAAIKAAALPIPKPKHGRKLSASDLLAMTSSHL